MSVTLSRSRAVLHSFGALPLPHFLLLVEVDIDVALQEKSRLAMSAGVAVVGNSASVVRAVPHCSVVQTLF